MAASSRALAYTRETVIRTSAEDVFAFCSDLRNELEWNPSVRSVKKLMDGPVGVGTRFRARWLNTGAVTVEVVLFDPPRTWETRFTARSMEVRFRGEVDATPTGARYTVHLELHPSGLARLYAPLALLAMRRQRPRTCGASRRRSSRARTRARDRHHAAPDPEATRREIDMSSATITPHDDLYRAKAGKPALVEVPPARFLMIDGSGSPDSEAFQDAVGALYAIAYTAKFALKKAGGPDVKVPPLERLYEVLPDPAQALDAAVRERLRWTLMIRLPEPIHEELVDRAQIEAGRKKDLRAIANVRVEVFDEGTAAQVLHIGPYSEEPATIKTLRGFIAEQGRTARGRHHEIYLSVPGRTKPERMKTILRQPVS